MSYGRLSRNTERQKIQFIVFKTRTKRIGEAWNCLYYSFYFASEQIEYFISVHWRVVSIYWALMWWVIHHSIGSAKGSSSCWSLWYLFIVCLIVMSKAFLKQRTNGCDTLITFCFRSFLASAMCIRQIHVCNQLHRYIVCIVVVIVCEKT